MSISTSNIDIVSLVPREIAAAILLDLTPKECARAGRVCKIWLERSSQDVIWREIAKSNNLIISNDNSIPLKKRVVEQIIKRIEDEKQRQSGPKRVLADNPFAPYRGMRYPSGLVN